MTQLKKIANNLYKLTLQGNKTIAIWFSYETPIAYQVSNGVAGDLIITKNIWSVTTGKHLNIINPDKTKRIDNNIFLERLQKAVND